MEKHVTVLGALYIAFNAMGMLAALVVFIAVGGGGLMSGNMEAIAITSGVATAVGGFLVLLSLPGLLAGYGLLTLKPWARVLTMILNFFNLLNIPFGTAVGIYGIWVLFQEPTEALFVRRPQA